MPNQYAILVMTEQNGAHSVRMEWVTNDKIPPSLNGEGGFHICYVRTLTELITRQLCANGHLSLPEEDIIAIALASTLHDIGKSRIPHAILESRNKLSAVEYDIVKKHAVFGEELVEEAAATMEPLLYRYAKQISRSHHERIDGTGYPDGLVGDDIPIAAQIVAIADAFNALTIERSYKNAFSQDVAIEMIANGMCGVFNPILVEALLQVVSHRELVEIRKHLLSSYTVHVDAGSFMPRKVLFLGNTRYVTRALIDATYPEAMVTVVGETFLHEDKKTKIYSRKNEQYEAILSTYQYDLIVFFSHELTYDTRDTSDAEDLRQVLSHLEHTEKETKFLYLSSLDAAYEEQNDRGVLSAAKENLCFYFARKNDIDIKVVRIPYLYDATQPGDYLHTLFTSMRTEGSVRFREVPTSQTYFLSRGDLAELIVRITDTWTTGLGILTVNDAFHLSFEALGEAFCELEPNLKIEYTHDNQPKHLSSFNTALQNEYGWFAKISLVADLRDQYEAYCHAIKPTRNTFYEKLLQLVDRHHGLVCLLELVALFVLTEVLVKVTDSALFFSLVDFRLAFVVVLATVHGLQYGIAAATLSSVAWVIAKITTGSNWMALFYEPTNWLPFIFYFLVGGVCGYVKLRKEDAIRFTKEENRLLEEKLAFTRSIYNDVSREKRDLKKQIIGSKDSFGKIFDITRQLNTVEPRELYLKIMDTFEDVLENKSISVFSVNEGSHFGRLEVASRDIMDTVSRSISLDTYAPVMEKIRNGEVWKNVQLRPGMPMYACGIFRQDKLLLLIFLWQADMQQRSLYYINLFRILCDLAQMSLLRARDYTQAMVDKQYIHGTRIQNAEAFAQNLTQFKQLAEKKFFRYLLFEVDAGDRTPEELDALLAKKVRVNDVIGMTEDGKVRILFAQAGRRDLPHILPRFEELGLQMRQIG